MEFRGGETQTREERKSSEAALGQRGKNTGSERERKGYRPGERKGSGNDGSREQTQRGEKVAEAN
jgi:hypothetical protein